MRSAMRAEETIRPLSKVTLRRIATFARPTIERGNVMSGSFLAHRGLRRTSTR